MNRERSLQKQICETCQLHDGILLLTPKPFRIHATNVEDSQNNSGMNRTEQTEAPGSGVPENQWKVSSVTSRCRPVEGGGEDLQRQ